MNRRLFLTGLGTLIGGIALEKAIPFNRVWSFPKEIVVRPKTLFGLDYFQQNTLGPSMAIQREIERDMRNAIRDFERRHLMTVNFWSGTHFIPADPSQPADVKTAQAANLVLASL